MSSLSRMTNSRRGSRPLHLCDVGSSALSVVVLLAVYWAYFTRTLVDGADGSKLWDITVGIACSSRP